MKTIVVIATALAVALATDTYSSEYDDFDAQVVVDNVRLLKNYLKCFLEEGPCTPEGLHFRKNIPDALHTSCAKCTPKQRVLIRTMANGFKNKLPDLWEQLVKKEDPKGEYTAILNSFLSGSD